MAEQIKRYQWKILRTIQDQFNGTAELHMLELTKEWESWKLKEIDNLIQLDLLKKVPTDLHSPPQVEITIKGKGVLRRNRRRFSDERFRIDAAKEPPIELAKNKEAVEVTAPELFRRIRNIAIWALGVWFVIAFFWEAFINHNKIALLIWLLICVLITIVSRRKW